MKPGNTLRAIESSQGCWNEHRAGCATMEAFALLPPVSQSLSGYHLYAQQHLAALKTASCWDLQSKVSESIFIATDICNMCQHSCESMSYGRASFITALPPHPFVKNPRLKHGGL
jgi:hypothetical protein